MGYCYEISNGRRRLVCDVCGFVGGVRKVACKYGYCPATAMCAGCRKSPGIRAEKAAHCDAHCREASAEYAAEKAREAALLDAGEYVRCSAVGRDGAVDVTFRNSDGATLHYRMSKDTYDAIPLNVPATMADYREHGGVIYDAARTAVGA